MRQAVGQQTIFRNRHSGLPPGAGMIQAFGLTQSALSTTFTGTARDWRTAKETSGRSEAALPPTSPGCADSGTAAAFEPPKKLKTPIDLGGRSGSFPSLLIRI